MTKLNQHFGSCALEKNGSKRSTSLWQRKVLYGADCVEPEFTTSVTLSVILLFEMVV